MIELFDIYKDMIYTFKFCHKKLQLLILSCSIVWPFALFYQDNIGLFTYSMLHTILVYQGFTSNQLERQARINGKIWKVLLETLPQFCVQMYELVSTRNSINFIQLGLPITTICFAVMFIAPGLGRNIF